MSHAATPILSIRDARKSYGKANALRGISLDLFAGELLGFLGPNGAGKTTLIRCLAGRSTLDSGSIRFPEATTKPPLIGSVPQNLAIYDDLTIDQNLRCFGKLHGLRGTDLRQRIDWALIWSNLGDRRRRLVKTLSGGMKRRLNIACSVLHDPQIVLLDEPTVGVDPQSRELIYDMLAEMRNRNTAILLTTHQLEEAQHRCDRIAIVDQGQVIREGTLDELVTSTVGADQRLTVRFLSPPEEVPDLLSLDPSNTLGTCVLSDVAKELPDVLQALQTRGGPIDHVMLQSPTLQHVFLHLTGKELRE